MLKIDIERLIDAIEEENTDYFNYMTSSKALYDGPFDELQKRKDHLKYCDNCHDRAQKESIARFIFGAPVLGYLHELPYWWSENQIGPFEIA